MKDGGSPKSTVADITSNPKNLQIKELEAAQIARSLNDVDIALVNTNYALNAGLNPLKDAVVVESKIPRTLTYLLSVKAMKTTKLLRNYWLFTSLMQLRNL